MANEPRSPAIPVENTISTMLTLVRSDNSSAAVMLGPSGFDDGHSAGAVGASPPLFGDRRREAEHEEPRAEQRDRHHGLARPVVGAREGDRLSHHSSPMP